MVWKIEAMGPHHDRSDFDCGVRSLDRYFHLQAGQDARRDLASPFVLVLSGNIIAGYYTLSAIGFPLNDLPGHLINKLPCYPMVPATLLGRLAVDRRYQGKGFGRLLLADALYRASRSEIASFAVVVDAKDEQARRFYKRESFLSLQDSPLKLFWPAPMRWSGFSLNA